MLENNHISKLSGINKLKFIFKDTMIYGISGAINKFFTVLTIPLLTYFFNPSEYGIIDFFSFLLLLLNILFIFGQDSAIARYFYEYDDIYSKKQTITQSLIFQIILLIFFLPIFWLLIDKYIGLESDNEIYAKLIILQTPFILLINFSQNILRWTFDKNRFLFLSIGSNIFTFLVIFIALNYIKTGVIELFIAYLFARFIFSIIGILLIKNWFIFPSNWNYLKTLMSYAIPFGIICLIGALLPTIERTYIIKFLNDKELGIYALGYKIALFIALPIEAFQIAWEPFSLSIFRDKNSIITYNRILKIFTIFIFSSVLLITSLSYILIEFLTFSSNSNFVESESENINYYINSSLVVFSLSMCLGIEGILSITEVGVTFAKKSYLKLYSYFVFLIVASLSIYLLIKPFGIVGVSWGTLLGYIAKSIIATWLSNKNYPINFNFYDPLKIGFITIIFGLISLLVSIKINFILGLYIAGIEGIIVILVGWFAIMNSEEKNKIILFFKKKIIT